MIHLVKKTLSLREFFFIGKIDKKKKSLKAKKILIIVKEK